MRTSEEKKPQCHSVKELYSSVQSKHRGGLTKFVSLRALRDLGVIVVKKTQRIHKDSGLLLMSIKDAIAMRILQIKN
ncbi:MAG: hypothetical protein JXR39_10300 [Marinilabiliaceae bacterium]|nr:hypothetical protein [Marinilabiliaceae bacterium]